MPILRQCVGEITILPADGDPGMVMTTRPGSLAIWVSGYVASADAAPLLAALRCLASRQIS